MRVLLIDDEPLAIDELCYFLKDYEAEIVASYTNPAKVLENIMIDKPDVVFIDIEMPGMNGIELSLKIQTILNDIIIVFVTAYSQYAFEAFKVHPIDYVLKPIRSSNFCNTMNYVMKQYQLVNQNHMIKENDNVQNKLFIRCFGKFEVVMGNEKTMKFATLKSKELFSYIICKADKPVYRDEVIDLFGKGNEPANALNNYYVTLSRLRNSIANFGFTQNDLVIKRDCSIYLKDGICDFVDFSRFMKNNRVIKDDCSQTAEKYIEEYNGELFIDLDYEWTNEAREWMEIHIEELIVKTALYYTEKKQFQKVEKILHKMIVVNPLSTQGFEALLDLYMKTGNKDRYSLVYRKYYKLMKEELMLSIDSRYVQYIQ